jgi:hypothetical protein
LIGTGRVADILPKVSDNAGDVQRFTLEVLEQPCYIGGDMKTRAQRRAERLERILSVAEEREMLRRKGQTGSGALDISPDSTPRLMPSRLNTLARRTGDGVLPILYSTGEGAAAGRAPKPIEVARERREARLKARGIKIGLA